MQFLELRACSKVGKGNKNPNEQMEFHTERPGRSPSARALPMWSSQLSESLRFSTHRILSTTLGDKHCYSQITEEETEVLGG